MAADHTNTITHNIITPAFPLVCPHCNLSATFHILLLLVNGNSDRSHRTPNHSRGAQEFWRAERRIIISCNGNNIRDLMGNKAPAVGLPNQHYYSFHSTEAERNSSWALLTRRIKEDWSLHSRIWRQIKEKFNKGLRRVEIKNWFLFRNSSMFLKNVMMFLSINTFHWHHYVVLTR